MVRHYGIYARNKRALCRIAVKFWQIEKLLKEKNTHGYKSNIKKDKKTIYFRVEERCDLKNRGKVVLKTFSRKGRPPGGRLFIA
jgi:hypothetical protein